MTINERCRLLPILEVKETDWYGGRLAGGGIMSPTPKYRPEVINWINEFYRLQLIDPDYLQNARKIKDKAPEELSRDEILTRLSWIIESEKTVHGMLSGWISDGSVERLCRRLHELAE